MNKPKRKYTYTIPKIEYMYYGDTVLCLRRPFTVKDVKEEKRVIARLKYEKKTRDRMKPKAIELNGAQFMSYCEQYNSLSKTEFAVYRQNLCDNP